LPVSFLWVSTQKWGCWNEDRPYCFPQWLYQFTFLPMVCRTSFLHTLIDTGYSGNSCPTRCEVLSWSPDDDGCREHVHTLTVHLYIFLKNLLIQSLCPFLFIYLFIYFCFGVAWVPHTFLM
jgi:hypothetical protein